MIGVGNLMEVIWPVIERSVGGPGLADRVIGVTADRADVERKRAVFGFEIVLDDNLGALRRNSPEIIMFSPPPTVAPQLIETVLKPYYSERRAEGGSLPELYAFPPVPLGAVYLEALGSDVAVVNMIPNNVTTIGGEPNDDEGHYVCTYPSPWPRDRVAALQALFSGQGSYVELEPHQIITMLGGAATISSLWFAIPAIADMLAADHNEVGTFLRAELNPKVVALSEPPMVALLAAVIGGWRDGVSRYFEDTDIASGAAATLVERGFGLTLHTAAVEPRAVLDGHAIGAATKGGVLERAIRSAREELLPFIASASASAAEPTAAWQAQFAELVTGTAHTVARHGATLAD